MNFFFEKYYTDLNKLTSKIDNQLLEKCAKKIIDTYNHKGKVIIAGNGGSASISSHVSIDLNKAAGITSINFNEASMITCLANDYGYENWLSEAIKIHCKKEDTVILISSSGESNNIINAMIESNRITKSTISLSGFRKDNKLSNMGGINLYVDSEKYNYVEIVHNNWLLSIVDYVIEIQKK